ncbi:alpha/beta-Hydrolases superfamily protein [Striga asiatica]|uniref:Alpha/beta-Hydrolases superfamily protein n=1 Tax=Striga asiatica TaxID=4170 RepID=A0A5A7PTB8_STRAF|nr:alpha/beta-Hydrolases superfamily protein [Striga asiatica]
MKILVTDEVLNNFLWLLQTDHKFFGQQIRETMTRCSLYTNEYGIEPTRKRGSELYIGRRKVTYCFTSNDVLALSHLHHLLPSLCKGQIKLTFIPPIAEPINTPHLLLSNSSITSSVIPASAKAFLPATTHSDPQIEREYRRTDAPECAEGRRSFLRLRCTGEFLDPNPKNPSAVSEDLQKSSQGSNAKHEFTRFRMPHRRGAHFARTVLRRRAAHLLRRDGSNDAAALLGCSMETPESFSQATDMHAAISHEQTADDAAIARIPPSPRTHKTKTHTHHHHHRYEIRRIFFRANAADASRF